LIGAHAVGRLMESLYARNTGLVVWFVPSEAIYSQTVKAFSKPGHPYRLALENAANGNLKVLDKRSQISRNDLRTSLCILVVMLQATVRERSDVLKIFRDSGAFQGLFPSVEDQTANDALRSQITNLDMLEAGEQGIPGISVRHSLANVLRCERPLFVIDEGHRAYTDLARAALNDLNPSFVLELTATPNVDGHHSNVLTSVSGVELKVAELIKLPISLRALIGQTWQHAIKNAMDLRGDLEKSAIAERRITGRHIRPIVLIRVEATGTRKAGQAAKGNKIHVDDVKEYLISKLRIHESWIRLKTASVNELGDDDLLEDSCPVRVILTKDALREGWDCPFAYVLVVLNAKTSKTAITQMTGRVLRQPYAQRAVDAALNEAHVICLSEDVENSVTAVCNGLQQEGMADVTAWVRTQGGSEEVRWSVARSQNLRGEFLLPIVAIKSGQTWAAFHPERDLLPLIEWKSIGLPDLSKFVATGDKKSLSVSVDLRSVSGRLAFDRNTPQKQAVASATDSYTPAVEALRSVIPNSWIAYDLIRTAEAQLLGSGVNNGQLIKDRMELARFLAVQLGRRVDKLLEKKFLERCKEGEVGLVACANNRVGVPLPMSVEVLTPQGDTPVKRADGSALLKNAFSDTYKSEVNTLELAGLRAIDEAPNTAWWWRVPVRGPWALLGWRRDAIYPDFVAYAKVGAEMSLLAIETKGGQLAGNDDTTYKKAVLAALQASYKGIPATPNPKQAKGKSTEVAPTFRGLVLEETSWRTDILGVLPPPSAAANRQAPVRGSDGNARRRSGPIR
jgi:type III restriction enzyme